MLSCHHDEITCDWESQSIKGMSPLSLERLELSCKVMTDSEVVHVYAYLLTIIGIVQLS